MNAPTKVSKDGQVMLPEDVLDQLGIQPGNGSVEFRRGQDGNVIIANANAEPPISRFAALRGIAGPGMSTDELMLLLRGEPE